LQLRVSYKQRRAGCLSVLPDDIAVGLLRRFYLPCLILQSFSQFRIFRQSTRNVWVYARRILLCRLFWLVLLLFWLGLLLGLRLQIRVLSVALDVINDFGSHRIRPRLTGISICISIASQLSSSLFSRQRLVGGSGLSGLRVIDGDCVRLRWGLDKLLGGFFQSAGGGFERRWLLFLRLVRELHWPERLNLNWWLDVVGIGHF
jgi:hypothetical protein